MSDFHLHIHRDHDALDAARQGQRNLHRHGFVRRPVRVGLAVIAVRPEGEAVFNDFPALHRPDVGAAPDTGREDTPVGVVRKDRRKPVNELRRTVIRLRQHVRVLRQQSGRGRLGGIIGLQAARVRKIRVPSPAAGRY